MRKWDRDELINHIDNLEQRNSNQEAYIDGLEDNVSALKHTIEKQQTNIFANVDAQPYEEMWSEVYCYLYNLLQLSENMEVCAAIAKTLSLMENLEEEVDENEERS